jgi:hypothetical protein
MMFFFVFFGCNLGARLFHRLPDDDEALAPDNGTGGGGRAETLGAVGIPTPGPNTGPVCCLRAGTEDGVGRLFDVADGGTMVDCSAGKSALLLLLRGIGGRSLRVTVGGGSIGEDD